MPTLPSFILMLASMYEEPLSPCVRRNYATMSLLLLSSNIEPNPGLPKLDTQAEQLNAMLELLRELNACSSALAEGQAKLIYTIQSVQCSQNNISDIILKISSRLKVAESSTSDNSPS